MQYKLIAVDMDGTLLDSSKNIRETSLAAIRKAVDAGVIFTIASGRAVPGVNNKYGEVLQLREPFISYNGAMVARPGDGGVLYEKLLDPETVSEIIRFGRAFKTSMCIWSKHKIYTFELTEKVLHYSSFSDIAPIVVDSEDILLEQGVAKALWYDEAEDIARYQQELDRAFKGDATYCTSSPRYLEFFHSDASKGNALRFLSDYYNIPPAEVIAVGDEMNDITMIEYAGLGVAMGNALDVVKAKADFVTRSNDEDGVAHVIERFLLT